MPFFPPKTPLTEFKIVRATTQLRVETKAVAVAGSISIGEARNCFKICQSLALSFDNWAMIGNLSERTCGKHSVLLKQPLAFEIVKLIKKVLAYVCPGKGFGDGNVVKVTS